MKLVRQFPAGWIQSDNENVTVMLEELIDTGRR